MQTKMQVRSGFTLIELVVVIGILAVLFAIVLIAINPSKQFKSANDVKRRSDVNAIINAVYQYSADKHGNLSPLGIGTTDEVVSFAGTGAAFCNGLVPIYIAALPTDPTDGVFTSCDVYDTKYTISQATVANGSRITVSAPQAESGEVISITR
jgi:prepilin-type N-terminal cleavage/methylation domain-containing protein